MAKRPIIVLTEGREGFYRFIPIPQESIYIYSFNEVDTVTKMEMDMLILDSGRDPLKGLKYLRMTKTKRPDVPIVFLTEESSEDIVVKTFKAGAREFFKKPVDPFEFQKRIKDLLELKRRARERRCPPAVPEEILKDFMKSLEHMPQHIIKSIYFMAEHIGERLSVNDIARIAGLSRYHFCRVFKTYTGMSPKRFLCMLRFERAKALLKEVERPVSEIAIEVGFDDLSNFIRYFKKYTGLTPTLYRKQLYGQKDNSVTI